MHEHDWSSFCSFVSGVSELADLPGECGANPRSQECQPGQGVRWCTRLEPDRRRGRRATNSGTRDQGHQDAYRGVVDTPYFTNPMHGIALIRDYKVLKREEENTRI